MKITVKDFLNKFDNKIEFSEKELEYLFWDGPTSKENDIVTFEGEEDKREQWGRYEISTFCINGRYFQFFRNIRLIQYQENEFFDQPIEVEKKVEKVLMEVVTWVKKN